MSFTRLIAPLALGMATFAATPASAAMLFNPTTGTVTVTGASGGTVVINMNGSTESGLVPGLSGQLELRFESAVNGLYTFGYTLRNTSTAPTTASRINAFGFDTDPDIVEGGARILSGSVIDDIRYDTTVPNGIGRVEICFTTHNCAGGGGTGLTIGQSTTGRFSLQFANTSMSTLSIGNLALRYQAVDAPGVVGGSATGVVTTAVPEPGTWALMLLGFGAVGFSMRRRRQAALLQLA